MVGFRRRGNDCEPVVRIFLLPVVNCKQPEVTLTDTSFFQERIMGRQLVAIILVWSCSTYSLAAEEKPAEVTLYDFENKEDLASWTNLILPEAKRKEPPVKIEQAVEHATFGKQGLKLTFAGGAWPTITTNKVTEDWLDHQTFHADVFTSRPCLVGFTVFQEKSQRGEGWDPVISRWTKTAFLQKGNNHVTAPLPQPNDYAVHRKWGKVVRFEIFMYQPQEGEEIYIDKIWLSSEKLPPQAKATFRVAGTDLGLPGNTSADGVIELGKKLKGDWTAPAATSVDQIEADFKAKFAELQKDHPKAVLAILRDGEKGFDLAAPDRPYAGWKDAYFNSHGPDGMFINRSENRGGSATHEIFMRHRSPLMQVDFSSIPTGSKILAARLLVVRAADAPDDRNPAKEPTMWVVEPCNRPWEEKEVNAFEYAKGKFWKAIGGMSWGDDPDFEPVFLTHGPSQVKASSWDFTRAVRYWTNEKHPNHGFMLHGDSHDYLMGYSREAEDIRNRPAVLVIYEPK
jgi:hypothetical protein